MSKYKPLAVLTEEASAIRKAKVGAIVPPVDITSGAKQGDLGFLDEFAETQGQIDRATPEAVRVEVNEASLAEAEAKRVTSVSDPTADYTIFRQARTPEEFATRLNDQLNEPVYSVKALPGGVGVEAIDSVRKSRTQHMKMSNDILTPLQENPRWASATDEWYGDSPYKGDVQFHVDRHTDPTRPNSFIQFEEPWEFGIHSGTNDAAERTIHPGGIEAVMRNMEEQAQAIEQIAGTLELPVSAVERAMAQAAERYLVQRFTKNADVNIWDEVAGILDEFVVEFNADPQAVGQFIAELKGMPTPSTTPFLFRGKRGLLLVDDGGFKAGGVAEQLEGIFNNAEDIQSIDVAMGKLGETNKQKALIEFIESKGYDHVVYHNTVEDKGSLSLINWNPDLMASPWDKQFTRGPADQARVASQYILGALGLGAGSAELLNE